MTKHEKLERRRKLRELASKVNKMTDEEKAQRLAHHCITTCEGHPLSAFNTIFLTFQANGSTPTIVGGYRQWKRNGRVVKKGEHSIGSIFVPMIRKKKNEEGKAVEEVPEDLRFASVPVFGIEQTEEAA